MGKNNKTPTKISNSRNKSIEDMLEEAIQKINILTDKVSDLDTALRAANRENEKLQEIVAKQEDEIAMLKDAHNSREQHARSWSVRILNITLPQGQETDTRVVMSTIYNSLFLPILEGAKAAKEITTIPTCEDLLETAHILPGKGQTKPIIARFYSRYWRSLIFRYRKEYAPKEDSAPATRSSTGAGATSRARMKYSVFEDLTAQNFKQLQSIKQHEAVTSAWTVNGTIKFRVKNNDNIYKISSLYDTVEDIIK
jgi:hypothetical protein